MPRTNCGFCEAFSNMTLWGEPVVLGALGGDQVFMAAFMCNSCRRLSIGATVGQRWPSDTVQAHFERPATRFEWFPNRPAGREYTDVPQRIASTASEAYRCLSIGAAQGAVSLARAVVEAVAKDNGIVKGSIQAKIDAMQQAHLLRESIAEVAHEVRLDGNSVAHGDLVDEPISTEEAHDVLELMDEVLQEVYQGPAKVARVRANREARKQATPASE